MKICSTLLLLCLTAYGADDKTVATTEATREVVDKDLRNGKGHIHGEIFFRGKTRILEVSQKTVAGVTKTSRTFILGDVTVIESEDDGEGRFKSLILYNNKAKQLEGFVGRPDGSAVPFDAKALAAAKEQFEALASFWRETLGNGVTTDKFLEAGKALNDKLKETEEGKSRQK